MDETAIGERVGRFPARNCPEVVEKLLELYSKEKQGDETFNGCMKRVGKDRIKEVLSSLTEIPSFEAQKEFYQDWGHGNEKFAVRTGIKGECAGAAVQEKAPMISEAKEKIAQALAFLAHKEFANAQIEAYEAMALGARVPLYASFCDPFTSEQTLWEFENIFVRSGRVDKKWIDLSVKAEAEKTAPASETVAEGLIDRAKEFLTECEGLHSAILQAGAKKP